MKRIGISILMLALCASAQAETLRLPDDLTVIGAEAFHLAQSVTHVIVPEGVTEIHSRAFAGTGLEQIELPESITYIADDALQGCENVAVTAPDGSYAYAWAMDQGYIEPPFDIVCSQKEAAVGDVIAWSVDIPEEMGEWQVSFDLLKDGTTSLSGAKGDSFSTMPAAAGEYSVKVTLTDDDGRLMMARSKPLTVAPAEATPAQQFEYTAENGEIVITDYIGTSDMVIVPSEIDGLPVRAVRFEPNQLVTRIVLPDSVTRFDGIESFYANEALTAINIPAGVNEISDSAFGNCGALTSVFGGSGVERIGNAAFVNCKNLAELQLGSNVTYVETMSFENCTALTEITLNAAITGIEYQAFNLCTSLARVEFVGEAAPVEGQTVEFGTRAFAWCPITQIELPEGVSSLRDYVFQDCGQLQAISLPSTITHIGIDAIPKWSDRPVISVTEGSYAHQWCIDQGRVFTVK